MQHSKISKGLTLHSLLLAGVFIACSDPAGDDDSGTGGNAAATGGTSSGSGGEPATGGSSAGTGGLPATGGASATGGAPSTGGSGGTPTTGGSGGTPSTGGSGGTPSSGGAPSTVDCASAPQDACPMASGLQHACVQRFALGINYAWHYFAGDFGGISAWSQAGVSQNADAIDQELADMRQNGVSVIRWWMFPDFRGDGVMFDGNGDPSGISPTALADIDKALELAAANDVHLVFTIFSFDNFRPDHSLEGLEVRGMSPMVSDASRRQALIENVVRPVAARAAASPHAGHLLGWDVINEPEWAVSPTGSAPSGADFDPNPELEPVSLADMKALIDESLVVLGEETPNALRSVGWAAAKWAWAFNDMANIDFHQPHIYGWVNDWWPYTDTPAELGYGDKPTVMGEFYLASMPLSDSDNASFGEIVDVWYGSGYAGAWAWQYADASQNIDLIKSFADAKGCSVSF